MKLWMNKAFQKGAFTVLSRMLLIHSETPLKQRQFIWMLVGMLDQETLSFFPSVSAAFRSKYCQMSCQSHVLLFIENQICIISDTRMVVQQLVYNSFISKARTKHQKLFLCTQKVCCVMFTQIKALWPKQNKTHFFVMEEQSKLYYRRLSEENQQDTALLQAEIRTTLF